MSRMSRIVDKKSTVCYEISYKIFLEYTVAKVSLYICTAMMRWYSGWDEKGGNFSALPQQAL